MRKRFHHCCLCSCSPEKGVEFMDVKILRDIVNRGVHAISCASTCAHKAHRGILLGDLCAEAHHPLWALKIWKFTLRQIHIKDYNDWIDVSFNTNLVRLQDVISEGICEVIGRRIDEMERKVGLSDAHGRNSWEYKAGEGWYNGLRFDKYDYDYEAIEQEFSEIIQPAFDWQQTERIFREGQNESVTQPQDFFDYWNDTSNQSRDAL